MRVQYTHLPHTHRIKGSPPGVHALRNSMIHSALLRIGPVTDAGSDVSRINRLMRRVIGSESTYS